LPWGSAKEHGMARYQLSGGLLKDDKAQPNWNPLTTGTSIIIARQFNRYQQYKNESGELSGAVHALELGIFYDNTDFPANPSEGSSQYLAYSYNPEWLESKEQWDFVEMEVSKYFSLGKNSFAKQNIIALNAWLLRGFRQNRFHDKAVVYATAEYRMTLDYNPIEDVRWLRFLKLDWLQTVLYVEGGRVSPTFNRDTLFSDWKSDVGVSLRALTAGIVVRLDFTRSKEGGSTWLMIGHPF